MKDSLNLLKETCKGAIGILQDIKSRHLGSGFHNNRVKADAEQGIKELKEVIDKVDFQKER